MRSRASLQTIAIRFLLIDAPSNRLDYGRRYGNFSSPFAFRLSPFAFRLSPFLIVLAALTISRLAMAQSASCELTRSPFLPWGALPSELACTFDEDGNGLDDAVERELAHCFAPHLLFDSREFTEVDEDHQPRADEPNTLFTVHAIDKNRIRVSYVALFHADGGFAADTDELCSNTHPGDNFPVRADITVSRGTGSWQAHLDKMSGGSLPSGLAVDGEGALRIETNGTHPIVYVSAGKHHIYAHPADICYDVDTPLYSCCWDRADGKGLLVIPGSTRSLTHVSAQAGLMRDFDIDGTGLPINLCHFVTNGTLAPTHGFRSSKLDDLGYPGQTLFKKFYDTEVTEPWETFADDLTKDTVAIPDADWDGLTNIFTANGTPTDRCGIDPDPAAADDDGDGLFGACDPGRYYRNVYVAGGSAAWPAYEPSAGGFLPGWVTTSASSAPRGGFLDRDGDGYVDGEDLCPSDPNGGLSNSNAWGERLNFEASQADGLRDLGAFYRGNRCDPYPATRTEWLDSGQNHSSSTCDLLQFNSGGASMVTLASTVIAGRSMNDPTRDGPDDRQFLAGVYRCACTAPDCLTDFTNDCFVDRTKRADEDSFVGRGWRAVERSSCERHTDGYCEDDLSFSASQTRTIRWEWYQETIDHPEHFAAGDVYYPDPGSDDPLSTGSDLGLTFPYAIATQVVVGASLLEPPGLSLPQIGDYPEPEQTPLGAKLLDLESDESRWLRTSFAEPRSIVSPYRNFTGAVDCPFVPPFDPCAQAVCNWRPFDPQIYYHRPIELIAQGPWTGLRVFWPGVRNVMESYIGLPELGALQRIVLADASHWGGLGSGTGVLTSFFTRASTTEDPSLLWVEHAPSQARWALYAPERNMFLQTASAASAKVRYTSVLEGVLPFGVSASARLLGSADGELFALFDPELRRLQSFGLTTQAWKDLSIPQELFDRVGPALAVLGSELVVLGGQTSDPTVAPQDWRISLGSGEARPWQFNVPARVGAQLTLGEESGSLVLVGGQDLEGGLHDDIWRLRPGAHEAERLAGDSARAASFDPRVAVLPPQPPLAGAAFSIDPQGGLHEERRDSSGWRAAQCLAPQIRDHALYGLEGVRLGPGSLVMGGPIGAGGGLLELKPSARADTVLTASGIKLGPAAKILSAVRAAGPVTAHPSASIVGPVDANGHFDLPGLDCTLAEAPIVGTLDIVVPPQGVRELAPGAYRHIVVKPQGRLRLAPGTYQLESLTMSPQARLVPTTSVGTLRIETRTGLDWHGEVEHPESNAHRILWVYFGTQPINFASALTGTLVAPRARVSLRGASRGAVFAKHVELKPGAELSAESWIGGW
jgi:hypothetical protein